jgi:hypothetical protein
MKQYVKLLEGKRLRLDLLARHSALTGVFAARCRPASVWFPVKGRQERSNLGCVIDWRWMPGSQTEERRAPFRHWLRSASP